MRGTRALPFCIAGVSFSMVLLISMYFRKYINLYFLSFDYACLLAFNFSKHGSVWGVVITQNHGDQIGIK